MEHASIKPIQERQHSLWRPVMLIAVVSIVGLSLVFLDPVSVGSAAPAAKHTKAMQFNATRGGNQANQGDLVGEPIEPGWWQKRWEPGEPSWWQVWKSGEPGWIWETDKPR